MAMTNFTENENLKLNEVAHCSAELAASVHNQLIGFSVLNILLSITAFLGNTLILVALHKVSSLHPPSKLLFRSLATTDLCVGVIAEPVSVAYWISLMNERWNICRFTLVLFKITRNTLCLASLMTLAAISVDRLLALLLGLRYRQVVTLKRTYVTVIALWIACVSVGSIMLPFNTESMSRLYILIIGNFSLVTSVYCYSRIFLRLRQLQTQVQGNVQGQPSNGQIIPLNIARYRKTVSTTRWLQLTLVACCLPTIVVIALVTVREIQKEKMSSSLFLAVNYATTLFYLNSSLNPILYCWKIREMRQAVKETLREICYSFN